MKKKFRICVEEVPEFIMAETADEAWREAIKEVGAYPSEEDDEDDGYEPIEGIDFETEATK